MKRGRGSGAGPAIVRTERTKAVRARVLRVVTAYRKGQPQPALRDYTNPAEAARACALEYERSNGLEAKTARQVQSLHL